MTIDKETLYKFLQEDFLPIGIKVIGCLIVLFIGLWIIKRIVHWAHNIMSRTSLEKTLVPFFASLISWTLKLALIFGIIAYLGFDLTSLAAILAAMAFAVGMALQGTLGNFAGGVLLLLFRPYKIGDQVEVMGGKFGKVKEIQIFNSIILSPQNKTIIVPNGAVMNGEIVNYTTEGKIRVDVPIGVDYSSNIANARDTLMSVMLANDNILKDPKPMVAVSELADSSINLTVRPWCKPEHYWDVYFYTLEQGKIALDEAGISIPFPQMDVHMKSN